MGPPFFPPPPPRVGGGGGGGTLEPLRLPLNKTGGEIQEHRLDLPALEAIVSFRTTSACNTSRCCHSPQFLENQLREFVF